MLNVSIVLYNPEWTQVKNLCEELLRAKCVRKIYLIDNSACGGEGEVAKWRGGNEDEQTQWEKIKYIWNEGKNLGYGRAHNIAIRQSVRWKTPFHLLLGADAPITAEDLDVYYAFMKSAPQIACLCSNFMLFPTNTMLKARLLDEQFEQYWADFDILLIMQHLGEIVFLPTRQCSSYVFTHTKMLHNWTALSDTWKMIRKHRIRRINYRINWNIIEL